MLPSSLMCCQQDSDPHQLLGLSFSLVVARGSHGSFPHRPLRRAVHKMTAGFVRVSKIKVAISLNLNLAVTSHLFHHILVIRSQSLVPAHPQEAWISQGHEYQEVEIISEADYHNIFKARGKEFQNKSILSYFYKSKYFNMKIWGVYLYNTRIFLKVKDMFSSIFITW